MNSNGFLCKNEYIPHVNRAIDDHDELELVDIFDKQCAVSFLDSPKNYLEKVTLINFDIMQRETKLTELKGTKSCCKKIDFTEIYIELAKLQLKAEDIKTTDFKNYENEYKLVAYKGTLKWDKKHKKLHSDTKPIMKNFVNEKM